MNDSKKLSEAGREQLALAIILLKDFKAPGTVDFEVYEMCVNLAEYCGVTEEFQSLLGKIPPMRVEPRYKGDY